MGLWDRQEDTGTTPKGGSPWDVMGIPNGTVGQTGHSQGWDSLGCPGDPRWDTGTTPKGGSPWDVPGTPNGTVGQTGPSWDNSQGWESLGCPEDLPMGLWDRQDTGTSPKGGSPWDVLGTPNGTVGQTGHWDNSQGWGVLGMSQGPPMGLCGTTFKDGSPWDVPGTPNGTVEQTGPRWDNSQGWESLGCPRDPQWDCGTDRTLGQLPRVGVLGMSRGLPHHSVGFGIVL